MFASRLKYRVKTFVSTPLAFARRELAAGSDSLSVSFPALGFPELIFDSADSKSSSESDLCLKWDSNFGLELERDRFPLPSEELERDRFLLPLEELVEELFFFVGEPEGDRDEERFLFFVEWFGEEDFLLFFVGEPVGEREEERFLFFFDRFGEEDRSLL